MLLFTKLGKWNPNIVYSDNSVNKPPLENEIIAAHLREKGQSVTKNCQQQIGKLFQL